MEGAEAYKLLLQSVDPENIAGVRDELKKLLAIGQGQAEDIVNSAPIILLDGIADLDTTNRIKDRFKAVTELGAQLLATDESRDDIPRLRWPELPEIARFGEEKKETKGEVMMLAKYEFVVDKHNVFRCPNCNKLFRMRELSEAEAREAWAQSEIAAVLQKQKIGAAPPETPEVAQPPLRVAEEEPVELKIGDIERVLADAEQRIEEVEPIGEAQRRGGPIRDTEGEILDLATFEEGLSATDYESPEVPELALPPDTENSESSHARKDFFEQLETLPVEGEGDEAEAQQPEEVQAAEKESELEELAPEEAVRFFEGRTKKEEKPKASRKKVVAPRRGGRRRSGREARDESDRRKPVSRKKRRREEEPEEEEEFADEVEHAEGFHGVVLSKISSTAKKTKAAKIIAEVVGVNREEARRMCDGPIINVLQGVSEEEAKEAAARFKKIGITARVTYNKRKKKQSERMERAR